METVLYHKPEVIKVGHMLSDTLPPSRLINAWLARSKPVEIQIMNDGIRWSAKSKPNDVIDQRLSFKEVRRCFVREIMTSG